VSGAAATLVGIFWHILRPGATTAFCAHRLPDGQRNAVNPRVQLHELLLGHAVAVPECPTSVTCLNGVSGAAATLVGIFWHILRPGATTAFCAHRLPDGQRTAVNPRVQLHELLLGHAVAVPQLPAGVTCLDGVSGAAGTASNAFIWLIVAVLIPLAFCVAITLEATGRGRAVYWLHLVTCAWRGPALLDCPQQLLAIVKLSIPCHGAQQAIRGSVADLRA